MSTERTIVEPSDTDSTALATTELGHEEANDNHRVPMQDRNSTRVSNQAAEEPALESAFPRANVVLVPRRPPPTTRPNMVEKLQKIRADLSEATRAQELLAFREKWIAELIAKVTSEKKPPMLNAGRSMFRP